MAPPLDDATYMESRLLLREATATPARTPLGPPAPVQRNPRPPLRRASLGDNISGRLIAALSGGWFLLLVISAAQPPPDGSHPTLPVWAAVMNTVADVALLATIVGFAVQQRWSLLTSAASAGLWTVAVLACPLVDHHETLGAAWGAALVTSAGLTAASVAAFSRGRGAPS
jgi:purine-cytosine permease-like protein